MLEITKVPDGRSAQKGFTLIELLLILLVIVTVVAVIVIL